MEGTSLIVRSITKMVETEGGSYYFWAPTESPILSQTKVGAGKLVLHPQGFAFPHYADSSKVGFVLEGNGGKVGLVLPNSSKEEVVTLRKGDIIPVPLGSISWWYNDGEDDFTFIFLGESAKAYIPGQFSYFLFAGQQSLLRGFSTDVLAQAYKLAPEDAKELATSQTGTLIVKLNPGIAGLEEIHHTSTTALMKQTGLSTRSVKLDADEIMGPSFCVDPESVQIMYVASGSGKVEIVGLNGEQLTNDEVKEGDIIVVPKLFPVAAIAGGDGLELLIVTTSLQPTFKELAGKRSVWAAFNPAITEASLNLSPLLEKKFLSGIASSGSNGLDHGK